MPPVRSSAVWPVLLALLVGFAAGALCAWLKTPLPWLIGPLFACAFYGGFATLLPLASGPEPQRLATVAPGAAFAALAVSSLLSLERLFERDFEDGALDLLALGAPAEKPAEKPEKVNTFCCFNSVLNK